MARLNKGILGGISGLVGTVIGSTWRGIPYIRSKGPDTRENSSDKQKAQQSKFSLTTAFLHTMKDLLQIGYKNQAYQMTEVNAALSHIMKNAVQENNGAYELLYPLVEISRGSLPNAPLAVAAAGNAELINFTWVNNSGLGKAKATDKAILVAHCPALKQTIWSKQVLRSAGAAVLEAPDFSGQTVQTWLSFVTEDEKDIATSVFTGAVNVL
ncbi:MAG: hypothetical protein J7497_16310 [Chitinophagaceae bacterium]|nr:hypothetical protein [Chitinophagaceae bacterium]